MIVEGSQRGPAPLSMIPWLKVEVFTGYTTWKVFHTVLAFDEIYRSLKGSIVDSTSAASHTDYEPFGIITGALMEEQS